MNTDTPTNKKAKTQAAQPQSIEITTNEQLFTRHHSTIKTTKRLPRIKTQPKDPNINRPTFIKQALETAQKSLPNFQGIDPSTAISALNKHILINSKHSAKSSDQY